MVSFQCLSNSNTKQNYQSSQNHSCLLIIPPETSNNVIKKKEQIFKSDTLQRFEMNFVLTSFQFFFKKKKNLNQLFNKIPTYYTMSFILYEQGYKRHR